VVFFEVSRRTLIDAAVGAGPPTGSIIAARAIVPPSRRRGGASSLRPSGTSRRGKSWPTTTGCSWRRGQRWPWRRSAIPVAAGPRAVAARWLISALAQVQPCRAPPVRRSVRHRQGAL